MGVVTHNGALSFGDGSLREMEASSFRVKTAATWQL